MGVLIVEKLNLFDNPRTWKRCSVHYTPVLVSFESEQKHRVNYKNGAGLTPSVQVFCRFDTGFLRRGMGTVSRFKWIAIPCSLMMALHNELYYYFQLE